MDPAASVWCHAANEAVTRLAERRAQRAPRFDSRRRCHVAAPQLPERHQFFEAENSSTVLLDLAEVSLVDLEVVRFLIRCQAERLRLFGCPAYIPEWMVREQRSQ